MQNTPTWNSLNIIYESANIQPIPNVANVL